MAASNPDLAPPANTIGRFRIKSLLGKGSQGVVYLAEDPELGRDVAIKTLRGSGELGTRLRDEARAVAKLAHPSIIPVYEIGEHAGNLYLVYEFVEGRSLRQHLEPGQGVPVHDAMRWSTQILAGIECAHQGGIVHRDLNPSNVMIDTAGNARIMDFGIALATGTRVEPEQGLSGTAMYMAPEQIQGAAVGPSADLFSAALILYEMLAGKHPVVAPDAMSAMYKIAHEPIPLLSSVNPTLAGPWDQVLARALALDPSERYPSALDLRQAIDDVRDAEDEDDSDDPESNSTFRFLLRRMRRRQDFPTISEKIVEISRQTASPDKTSVNELSNAILHDYALTTKLLKLVNSSFYSQYGGRISTVSRAVVLLGFKQVRMAAQSLALFEHIGNAHQSAALREAAGLAQMGGIIAQTLGRQIGIEEPEEAFVGGMFRRLGRFLTMFYLPEEFADINAAMTTKGMDEERACRQVLGLGYDALGIGIARNWQLPESIIDCLRPFSPANLDGEAGEVSRLRLVTGFSNELAEALTGAGPDSSDTEPGERVRALKLRYARALPLDDGDLERLIGEALEMARAYGPILDEALERSGAFRGAEQWLGRGGEGAPASRTRAEDDGGALPGTGSTEAALPHQSHALEPPVDAHLPEKSHPADASTTVLSGIQDITNALIEGCNVNDVLVMVLETLYRGLTFTRVMLCIRDQRRGIMAARFGLGKDVDELKPRMRFKLETRDVFANAVRSGTDLLYPARGLGPAQLPSWYRRLVQPTLAVALPIMVNDVCVGLIYADREDAGARLDRVQRSYLNMLRNQAALAVKHSG